MRVAVSQKKCEPGNVGRNCADYQVIAHQAKQLGAQLVVFPELSDTAYDLQRIKSLASDYETGTPLNALKKAAVERGISIVAGITEKLGNDVFNAAVAINTDGDVIANYRKIHLYTPSGEGVFTAGNAPVLFDLHGFRIGLQICYDLRFPEFARYLACEGASVILIPTAWPFPRVEHWNLLTRARAIENQCYVIGANHVGHECGFSFCGNSRVVDPHGVLVTSASEDQEELLVADLSHAKIDFVRNRQPIFSHMRRDIFG
jgi:predicted amidohydrolase